MSFINAHCFIESQFTVKTMLSDVGQETEESQVGDDGKADNGPTETKPSDIQHFDLFCIFD